MCPILCICYLGSLAKAADLTRSITGCETLSSNSLKGSARVRLCASVRGSPTAMRRQACCTFLAQNFRFHSQRTCCTLSENIMMTSNQTFFYPAESSCIRIYRLPVKKGKSVPLQAWTCPEGSRKLRFLHYVTMAQNGGKVVSLTHGPPLPPRNTHGSHFC